MDLKPNPSFIQDSDPSIIPTKSQSKSYQALLRVFNAIANHKVVIIVLNIFVFYSLISNDLRTLLTNRHGDVVFDVFTCIVFIGFIFEIFLYWVTVKNYMCSFYFWIDLSSTFLLMFDMTFIANPLFYGASNGSSSSRVLTRLGKYFRIIRLIRLLKLVKDSPEIDQVQDTEIVSVRFYILIISYDLLMKEGMHQKSIIFNIL